MFGDYLRFDDVLETVFFGAVGHPHESTLLGTASHVADLSKHVSYTGRTPAENIFRHCHATIHRQDLIGAAACERRFCRMLNTSYVSVRNYPRKCCLASFNRSETFSQKCTTSIYYNNMIIYSNSTGDRYELESDLLF